MKILCVIPSRIGSTRLPRKPLLPIQGKPMVQWVYESAKDCHVISEVVVATDSEEIAEVIQKIGGKTMLTPTDLLTGTDRVAFVANAYPHADVVINLQGDEPFVKPEMLVQLVAPYLAGETPEMTTLARSITHTDDYSNPNIVKVILDRNHHALYFSRSAIPYFRMQVETAVPVYHHIGLYAFRRNFLLQFTALPQTPLEKIEALEQLRALEEGIKIRVCLTAHRTLEINTQAELERANMLPV